jgi:hypothetical protein
VIGLSEKPRPVCEIAVDYCLGSARDNPSSAFDTFGKSNVCYSIRDANQYPRKPLCPKSVYFSNNNFSQRKNKTDSESKPPSVSRKQVVRCGNTFAFATSHFNLFIIPIAVYMNIYWSLGTLMLLPRQRQFNIGPSICLLFSAYLNLHLWLNKLANILKACASHFMHRT